MVVACVKMRLSIRTETQRVQCESNLRDWGGLIGRGNGALMGWGREGVGEEGTKMGGGEGEWTISRMISYSPRSLCSWINATQDQRLDC